MSDSPLAEMPRSNKKKTWRMILMAGTVGITITILGVMVYRQWDVLVSYPWEFHPLPILASLCLYSVALFLVVWVWADMMRKLGYPLGYWRHFRYYCLTNLAKRLPGTVWYIAGRAQLYKEDGVSRKVTSIMSGVELGVTVISGIVTGLLFGSPILLRYEVNLWMVGGILLGCMLLLHPHILGFIMKKLGSDVSMFKYRDLLIWILCYLLVWVAGGGILFFVCRILVLVDFSYFGYMIGSWAVVSLLGVIFFFSPSNLGISELGFTLLLTTIVPAPVAVVLALLIRIVPFLYELFWAFLTIGLEKRRISA